MGITKKRLREIVEEEMKYAMNEEHTRQLYAERLGALISEMKECGYDMTRFEEAMNQIKEGSQE